MKLPAKELAGVLEEHAKLVKWLGPAKEREMELRKILFAHFFDKPKEGANTAVNEELNATIKGNYKLSRELDEAALSVVLKTLPAGTADKLIKTKPSLILKAYRAFWETNPKEAKLFDRALIVKPASPELEIIYHA
jgi:hypothetical protein